MKLLLLLLFFTTSCNTENNNIVHKRCRDYVQLAQIIELQTGVPASIQLAQAYYESHLGRSYIGRNGNNFFGMRCGDNYNGDVMYTESGCWRCYETIIESWIDHAIFMRKHYPSAIDKPYTYYRQFKGYGGAQYWKIICNFIESNRLQVYDLSN